MQDYPVFNAQKYDGLGLILSNSSYRTRPYVTQSQTYHTNYSTYRPNNTYSTVRQRSPPPIKTKPEGSVRSEQRLKSQLIKGTSRIQYVPVQKKVVDYVDQTRYSLVPRKRTVTDYRDFVRVQMVPKEVVETDYYAVQHIRSYIPQVIPQKYVDYVPVQHKNIKYEYIPVQRQLVHYPQHSLQAEKPRYLGIKETQGPRVYENIRNSDIEFWEREYGYVRGQPISVLNEKIKRKIDKDKELFFQRFQTADYTASRPNHYKI